MTSKNKKFTAVAGEENSLTINRTGIPNLKIGFITNAGEFFLKTDNEQVLIHAEDLKELSDFITSLDYIHT